MQPLRAQREVENVLLNIATFMFILSIAMCVN